MHLPFLPSLLPIFLLLLCSLHPCASRAQLLFPTNFPTAYSASVSLNFGGLNYSSSFDEYAHYDVFLDTSRVPSGQDLVQSRGRYVDRNTWLYFDQTRLDPAYANEDIDLFFLSTHNGDVTNLTSCSILFETGPAAEWALFSLAIGPTMAMFSSVLPRLEHVDWEVQENVLIADRKLTSTLWTMTTPITISPANSVVLTPYDTTLTSDQTVTVYDTSQPVRSLPFYYPINELVDINFRGREALGLIYGADISSIQVYLAPNATTFPDGAAYNIPYRMTISGTLVNLTCAPSGPCVPNTAVARIPFSNQYDWTAVQPVQFRPYNPPALRNSCTILDEAWVPLMITSIASPILPPAINSHPNATSFPPSFQATMEALLTLPPPNTPGSNAPFIMSQFREFTHSADGTTYWDENNQLMQVIGASTFDWYQFNHTTTGGGSHWQINSTAASNASTPYTCTWAELAGGNRSPIDYIHEAELTKLYSMANATIYLPTWNYSHSAYARGIFCDVYTFSFNNRSRTDNLIYTWTQSLYTTAKWWPVQARTLPDDAQAPVMIVTNGTYADAQGNTYSYTDYVHFFTIYTGPNPTIYNPQGYGCQPAPKPVGVRPLFPSLSTVPSSYSATITLNQFLVYRASTLTAYPVTWAYTEYARASPPFLRVDGHTEGVNSIQLFDLVSGVSTNATNPHLDAGALGYSDYPDYATHAATSNAAAAAACSTFTATPAQLSLQLPQLHTRTAPVHPRRHLADRAVHRQRLHHRGHVADQLPPHRAQHTYIPRRHALPGGGRVHLRHSHTQLHARPLPPRQFLLLPQRVHARHQRHRHGQLAVVLLPRHPLLAVPRPYQHDSCGVAAHLSAALHHLRRRHVRFAIRPCPRRCGCQPRIPHLPPHLPSLHPHHRRLLLCTSDPAPAH